MAPILANAEVQQRLLPFLPSGESLPQSKDELHNTLTSPQFQQVKSLMWFTVLNISSLHLFNAVLSYDKV